MEDFEFTWRANIERSVRIKAETIEEAHEKWMNEEYGIPLIISEEQDGDIVSIDGVEYYDDRFEKSSYF